jgi:hypothetical protein
MIMTTGLATLQVIPANMTMMPPGLEATLQDLKRLQDEVTSSAQKYFEVKGDIIVFKNTDELAKIIHAALVKLNAAAQTTIKALNGYADEVKRMDDRTLCTFVIAKFLEFRVSDPSMIEMLGVLAAAETQSVAADVKRLMESALRKLAHTIDERTRKLKKLANNPSLVRAGVWAALKNNTFNWRKQQFEAAGSFNLIARFANWWKLNPAVAKAKGEIGAIFLASAFSRALSTIGLPGPAATATADMLAALATSDEG